MAAKSSENDPDKDRLKAAINLLVRDQEHKYDECLVERFFSFLPNGDIKMGSIALQVMLEIYADSEFASMNQARLFKFQLACYEYYLPRDSFHETSSIQKSSEMFWSRLPQVISKNDPAEIKAALSLLITITDGRRVHFMWVIDKLFQEPIQSGRIKDVVSLARYFLTTGKNYHIQNLACELMAQLIKQSCKRPITTEQFYGRLKQHIEELLELGCPSIYYVLYESLIDERLSSRIVNQLCLDEVLKRSLDNALARENQADMISISKCLALAKIEDESIVKKLNKAGQLGAIITYATNIYRDIFEHKLLMHYLIYPILLHCEGEDAEVLIGDLIMARPEKQFVERYMQDKYVIQCLHYLKRSLSIQERHIDDSLSRQPKRTFIMLLDVLLEFIRSNYNNLDREYKNLLECCLILRNVQERFTRKSETMWLYKLMDTLLELIEPLDDKAATSKRKVIVLEIIRLMSFSMRKITIFRSPNFTTKTHSYRLKIVEFAIKITQPEILEEIASLFHKCDFDFWIQPANNHLYVELVWQHMYKLARKEHDRALLAGVVMLLPAIDVKARSETLTKFNLVRYQTIPKLLSELLDDLATDDTSIELIAKSINYAYPKLLNPDGPYVVTLGVHPTYVSLVCKSSSEEQIEHLARGICSAIKRDLYNTFHKVLMKSLRTILQEYVRPKNYPLEALMRTRILETLHYIHETSTYTEHLRVTACDTIASMELFNTYNLTTLTDTMINQINAEDRWRREQTRELAKFYGVTCRGCCDTLAVEGGNSHRANNLDLFAYVDQIINQIGVATLECH